MVSSVRHFWWNIQVCGHRHNRINRIESLASMSQFNYWKFAFLSNSIFFFFSFHSQWTKATERGEGLEGNRDTITASFPFSFAIQTILNFVGDFWRNCISFCYNLRARVFVCRLLVSVWFFDSKFRSFICDLNVLKIGCGYTESIWKIEFANLKIYEKVKFIEGDGA